MVAWTASDSLEGVGSRNRLIKYLHIEILRLILRSTGFSGHPPVPIATNLFFLWFPLYAGEAGRRTAIFVICFHWSLLLAFLSTFLPPLPFSDLSSHNPPILAVRVFLVFCNLLAYLSRIVSVIFHLSFWPCVQPISPAALNYFGNNTSFSSNFISQVTKVAFIYIITAISTKR